MAPRLLPALLLLAAVLAVPLPAQVIPVAVERRLAARLALDVGDTVRLGAAPDSLRQRAVVAAVYDPAADPTRLMRGELQVRLHLPDLAALLGAPDRVDRFSVVLAPGADPGVASRRLNASAFGYRAFPSDEVGAEASQTFVVVSRFHRAIGVISIVASAIFLLCIMLLKVEERRLDAAVMRFVGVRRRTIFLALLLEASLVALLGSCFGTVLAWLASAATNAWYRRVYDTALTFSAVTAEIVFLGVGLSLALGLLAGGLAAARLVRTRPMVLWGRG
jgi:putative ABC transport system permease protein